MPATYDALAKAHPCFANGGRPANTGRIHLPVSPGCNMGCKFCCPSSDSKKNAPAVAREVIRPAEAVDAVRRALELCPSITVVGIAGPGDTLATPWALETFRLIGKEFPFLFKCMSTNGLLLPEKAGEVLEAGIDSLTVTVNAIAPEIEARLNDYIVYHGKRYTGEEAAKILIENQLKGIRAVAQGGTTVKVNTVLVPGTNDRHIEDIAKAVSGAGAKIHNIIPLIPQGGLADVPRPTCKQVDAARVAAEPYISVFRHCQHCRADAAGIPGGKDYGQQIYLKRIAGKETFSHG